MLNFVFKIEADNNPFDSSQIQWTDTFIDAIERDVELSDKELQQYAKDISEDIKSNIFYGKTFTGGNLPALEPYTIRKKGHAKPLIETFELYRSIATQKIPSGYEIFILPGRAHIAYMLQTGTFLGNRKKKKFEFFGITPQKSESILESLLQQRRGAA